MNAPAAAPAAKPPVSGKQDSSTVENRSQTVCNKGTEHTAKSDDECMNGIHENSSYSKNLDAGTASQRTQIGKNPIAMEQTIWKGSESTGIEGVKTHKTCDDALVFEGSRDLKIEKRWAARRDDKTKNNALNSEGKVVNGFVKPEAGSLEERMKKKCFLESWKGEGSEGKGSVPLGYKGKDKTGNPNWLEVYDDATLTFNATRKDITDPDHPDKPKCLAEEQHTIWTASGTKFPLFGEKVAPRKMGQDEFVFKANMFLNLFANSDFMAKVESGDMAGALDYAMENSLSKWATNDGHPDDRSQDYGADNDLAPDHAKSTGQLNAFNPAGNVWNGKGVGPQLKGNDWAGVEDGKWQKDKYQPKEADDAYAKKPVKETVRDVIPTNWPTILFYFWWWIRAPTIKVTASGCGGAREATIRVHPKFKCKFDINLTPVAAALARGDKKKKKQNEKDLGRDKYEQGKQLADAQKAVDQAKKDYAGAQGRRDTARGAIDGNTPNHPQAADMTPGGKNWEDAQNKFIQSINEMIKFKAKWDKAQRQLDQAKSALDNTDKALDLAQKISTTAGSPMNVRFCENLKLEVKMSYERTTERNSGMRWRWYTPQTMGQRWEFKLQVQPLIKVTYRIYFSLLNFLLVWAPGAAQILRRFRVVRVDLYFMISMSISVSGVTVTKTEHDDIEIGGPEVDGDVIPRFGLVAGVGGVDIIDGYISAPINFKFVFVKPNKKGDLMLLSPQVRITNHYRIVLFPDRWWEIEAMSGTFKNLKLYFNTNGRWKTTIGSVPS